MVALHAAAEVIERLYSDCLAKLFEQRACLRHSLDRKQRWRIRCNHYRRASDQHGAMVGADTIVVTLLQHAGFRL